MKLYLHFGIYKAGSSYLQYICANQREYLKEKHICFPESKEDHKMNAGLISKGNADGLETAMKSENENKITEILEQWHTKAEKTNSKAVLISAEALVHQLAIEKRLHQFISCTQTVGFSEIKAMGFFRDLADHALSTYKHRAKTGRIPDYKHWVSQVYETPKLLENLSQVIASYTKIDWTLRKFQKDSDFLKQAFFKDWLGIDVPDFQTRPNVNESVTLSEVKLMNHYCKIYPGVIDFFVEDLKALSSELKAKDKVLQDYILNIFSCKLADQQSSIDQINVFFPKDEYLEIGKSKNLNLEIGVPPVELSEEQLNIVSKRMQFFETFEGKKVLLRRRIAKYLPGVIKKAIQ